MKYNYHTHTYHCKHAVGAPEEYIKRAIACGVTHLGFSDHAPLMFPAVTKYNSRMLFSEVEDYIGELKALRETYKDQIDLKIGFEMEYYPTYFADMMEKVRGFDIEYLILGQHFTREEGMGSLYVTRPIGDVEDFKEHVACTVAGIHSDVFTYVAHPDVFNFSGDEELYRKEMRKICVASRECNVPLEINLLGIRDHRNYPNEVFWKMAGEEQSPVVFGFDAHDPQNAYDGASLEKAKEMVEKFHLNYIGRPTLRSIQ